MDRLDLSDEFWKEYEIYNYNTKKVIGLFEIENINNQNICTIAINPKEYFEKIKDRKLNNKHKGVRKDTPGMNFESYTMRINIHLGKLIIKKKKKKLYKKGYKLRIQI